MLVVVVFVPLLTRIFVVNKFAKLYFDIEEVNNSKPADSVLQNQSRHEKSRILNPRTLSLPSTVATQNCRGLVRFARPELPHGVTNGNQHVTCCREAL